VKPDRGTSAEPCPMVADDRTHKTTGQKPGFP
jgi:hypothetical protein